MGSVGSYEGRVGFAMLGCGCPAALHSGSSGVCSDFVSSAAVMEQGCPLAFDLFSGAPCCCRTCASRTAWRAIFKTSSASVKVGI